jgi:hypothetical protein
VSKKRESHKQALRQLLDLYEVGVCLPMTRDELIDAILRVNNRFNLNPSLNEALNSDDGSYKP